MLLALDSSTRFVGIALYEEGSGLIAEASWRAGVQHTVTLMPRIAQMLADVGASPDALSAAAVALGPGSLTGVRVALATAKGLALANGLALLGIPTLDVTAYAHQKQPLPVIAVVQAGRGRICWAQYAHGAGGWGSETPYTLSDIVALAAQVTRPTLFAGELTPADRATLREQLAEKAIILPPALALRRAGCLAEMGWQRLAAGERDDLATLSPLYLMEKPAGDVDRLCGG